MRLLFQVDFVVLMQIVMNFSDYWRVIALATGNTAIPEGYAMYLVYAHILQSTVHIIPTSVIAVLCSFCAFLVQVGIFCNLD